jgi:hypothetical protein
MCAPLPCMQLFRVSCSSICNFSHTTARKAPERESPEARESEVLVRRPYGAPPCTKTDDSCTRQGPGRTRIVHGALALDRNRTRQGPGRGTDVSAAPSRPLPGTYMPHVRRAGGTMERRGTYIALVRRHEPPTSPTEPQVIIFMRYSCRMGTSATAHTRNIRARTRLGARPPAHTRNIRALSNGSDEVGPYPVDKTEWGIGPRTFRARAFGRAPFRWACRLGQAEKPAALPLGRTSRRRLGSGRSRGSGPVAAADGSR